MRTERKARFFTPDLLLFSLKIELQRGQIRFSPFYIRALCPIALYNDGHRRHGTRFEWRGVGIPIVLPQPKLFQNNCTLYKGISLRIPLVSHVHIRFKYSC